MNSEPRVRRRLRLPDYDYSQAGAYFVTICTKDRRWLLGDFATGKFRASDAGRIVLSAWYDLPSRFELLTLDEFVVMPNHVHGILLLAPHGRDESRPYADGGSFRAPVLGEIVRAYKAVTTKKVHAAGLTGFGWQRNYYEHIIRTARALDQVRQYVVANPENWEHDPELERLNGV